MSALYEEADGPSPAAPGQQIKDWQATFLIDLSDEVSGVVWFHTREQTSGLRVRARLEKLELVGRIELLKDVRLELAIEADGLNDLLALFVARLFDEVSDLGWVELCELAIRDAQTRCRHVGDERLNGREVDNAIGLHVRADLAPEDATEEGATTRVDAHHFPASIDLCDLDLIGDHDATAHQVDEVTSEKVLCEKDLSRAPLKTTKVHSPAFKCHTPFGKPADLLDRHEKVPALDADHRAHDRRVRIVAESRDQVLDASNLVTVRVVDRTMQER